MLKVLDLFSGIGGFSLGLESTGGFETIAFCEIERYPRAVLAKNWPGVPQYEDIRDLTARRLATDGLRPNVICGGFPCQDISSAGNRAGIGGKRSSLWFEFARLIGELRPRYAIVENVSALLVRGLGDVLGSLAEIGYDAEWHCIPASAVGAPHIRDRIWIIAYPQHPDADEPGSHREGMHEHRGVEFRDEQVGVTGSVCQDVADAECSERRSQSESRPNQRNWHDGGWEEASSRFADGGEDVANPDGGDSSERDIRSRGGSSEARRLQSPGLGREVSHAVRHGLQRAEPALASYLRRRLADPDIQNGADASGEGLSKSERDQLCGAGRRDEGRAVAEFRGWATEPNVGRVAHGVRSRVDRLKCLGNAVVPQVVQVIGEAILQRERDSE